MNDEDFYDHVVFFSEDAKERFKYTSPAIKRSISRLLEANLYRIEQILTDETMASLLRSGEMQIIIEMKDRELEYSILTKNKMFVKKDV